jgi:hypothetical protein
LKYPYKLVLLVMFIPACFRGPASSTPELSTSTPWTPPTVQPTATLHVPAEVSIAFQKDDLDQPNADEVWMNYPKIYALDSNILFLYGSITGSNGSALRSMLLRSEDGGLHWQEVLKPIYANSVLFISFIENGEGWAMTAWTMEGVTQPILYHSTDYGETWLEVSATQMWIWPGGPSRMQFLSSLYGEMDIVYINTAPGKDRIAKLATSDGGQTWNEISAIPFNKDGISIYENYRAALPDRQLSVVRDNSIWHVEDHSWKVPHILYVKLDDDISWRVIGLIPNKYRYENGSLTILE